MALVECRECKARISTEALACPQCGAKRPKPTSRVAVFFVGLVVIGIWMQVFKEEPVHTAASANAAASHETPAPAPPTGWAYSTQTEKMNGKAAHYAQVVSDNSLNLEFPYGGYNAGRIWVRKRSSDGLKVIVAVEKGQINCRIDGCTLKARFDEGQPITFAANEPSDHSSTSVFIKDAQGFAARAQKAKKILVQLEFFQNGLQILEFRTPTPLRPQLDRDAPGV